MHDKLDVRITLDTVVVLAIMTLTHRRFEGFNDINTSLIEGF